MLKYFRKRIPFRRDIRIKVRVFLLRCVIGQRKKEKQKKIKTEKWTEKETEEREMLKEIATVE